MPNYFAANQTKIDLLPDEKAGLRNPQLGAASALLAFGTRHRGPAIISLPTGTGKTAVLQITPFLWSASRVLVLTPSRLVREQITRGFRDLALLKELGVLPEDLEPPKVASIAAKLVEDKNWEDLRLSDVVVTTPNSASPSIAGIARPPEDLFDLVMVDEAHHAPAVSYATLLDSFPDARKAFFTATPFRRDNKILAGKTVYSYPLKSAIEDGTYGKVEYLACEPADGENHDEAIAAMAEEAFESDRLAGHDHRLMVRTDSVARAEELAKVYENTTKLQLRLIKGGHSLGHVTSVIKKLNAGELDGIICVDMFGEGVDFPRLKIAALHSPHKSLAVTLQFIGRFARTNASDIGAAKFIAVPQEIDAEVRALFKSGANWEDLVANLADARVEEEESVREGLASFETEVSVESEELDLTIDSLNPYFHAKVYESEIEPDWENTPFIPPGCELVFHSISNDLVSAVIVLSRKTKPKWLEIPALFDSKHILMVVHYNRLNQLLFVNSTEHGEDHYQNVLEHLYPEDEIPPCIPLDHDTISRALRILNNPSFYNLGMRNRELGGQDESYRTLAGRKADRRVSRTDANTRSRGHVYGGSKVDGKSVTLGVSTLSKLWSNKYGLVPRYVDWCHNLAIEIASPRPVETGSNIDMLDTGRRVSEIPAPPIGIVWNEHAFLHPQILSVEGSDDDRDLTGLDLVLDTSTASNESVEIGLIIDDIELARFRYAPSENKKFERLDGGPELLVQGPFDDGTLEEFLCLLPPTVFLADFSTLVGDQWYRGVSGEPLDRSTIRTFSEFGSTVDIQCEFSGAAEGMKTIHEFTEEQFLADSSDVVIYDHRAGEVADYISIRETDDAVICKLAHCKGASGRKSKTKRASSRVDDAYEVAGQVVKCLPFRRRPEDLKDKLVRRIASGSALKRGTVEKLERILDAANHKQFEFRVCLVQPGLSASGLNESVESVLAAAGEYVTSNGGTQPEFWFSD